MSTTFQHRTTNKTRYPNSLMILHNGPSAGPSKNFCRGPSKLGNVVCQVESQLNPEKTEVIIFSRSNLARKTEPHLKPYGETLKTYPQVSSLPYTRTRLAQSSDLESIANTDCPGRLIPKMPQASPSNVGHKEGAYSLTSPT